MARAIPSKVPTSALSIKQVNALYDAITASSTVLIAPTRGGKTTALITYCIAGCCGFPT